MVRQSRHHIKVEGIDALVRDKRSSAIINTDKNAWEAAKHRRQRSEMLDRHDSEISNMKQQLDRIETLLEKLVNK